jgi:hypothetical protein
VSIRVVKLLASAAEAVATDQKSTPTAMHMRQEQMSQRHHSKHRHYTSATIRTALEALSRPAVVSEVTEDWTGDHVDQDEGGEGQGGLGVVQFQVVLNQALGGTGHQSGRGAGLARGLMEGDNVGADTSTGTSNAGCQHRQWCRQGGLSTSSVVGMQVAV